MEDFFIATPFKKPLPRKPINGADRQNGENASKTNKRDQDGEVRINEEITAPMASSKGIPSSVRMRQLKTIRLR